ncbi:MAG: UDP-glucose/GDP-mannose dehydrogenase family protein, partial [Burkholderiaceae bacterium]|nr:UDP-glucose/GDP-mannose dehydrogenase family protein [Burkholderiaceae bacterium]
MKLSVIGTGYVGLVSGTCLADKGHDVICVDVDREKVERVNRGESPIFERGLQALLEKNAGKRLRATTDLEAAVRDTELTLIAVGTPFDGMAIDLRFIEQVSRQIGAALAAKSGYHVVVIKST